MRKSGRIKRGLPAFSRMERIPAAAPERLLFLPGASGNTRFWLPVAEQLRVCLPHRHLGWPGFGGTPRDPAINSWSDLLDLVLAQLDGPCALIAQSMGGVLAVQAALQRPRHVTHLVLAATSGGLPMARHGALDWRPGFRASHPDLPAWFSESAIDLSAQLPQLRLPVLLLWGDADPISPVSVGEALAQALPLSRLHVIPGGDHDLALTHAAVVAPLIAAHLQPLP
jgi:pimeloyl-ACP methyl ester carboxylesterase